MLGGRLWAGLLKSLPSVRWVIFKFTAVTPFVYLLNYRLRWVRDGGKWISVSLLIVSMWRCVSVGGRFVSGWSQKHTSRRESLYIPM
jgi:hypothetical protein